MSFDIQALVPFDAHDVALSSIFPIFSTSKAISGFFDLARIRIH
jgi:hypothetical protein